MDVKYGESALKGMGREAVPLKTIINPYSEKEMKKLYDEIYENSEPVFMILPKNRPLLGIQKNLIGFTYEGEPVYLQK